ALGVIAALGCTNPSSPPAQASGAPPHTTPAPAPAKPAAPAPATPATPAPAAPAPAPAGDDLFTPKPMSGPFSTLKDAAPAGGSLGDTAGGTALRGPAKVASGKGPYEAVQLAAITLPSDDGIELRYLLAVKTSRGWFTSVVYDPGMPCDKK